MTYIPKVYKEDGGDKLTAASGGTVEVQSGGTVEVQSGGTVEVQSGGTVEVQSGGTVEVQSGGILDLQSGSIPVGAILNLRSRVTIAQANAGESLLAALTGYKYRLLPGSSIIAVGGAAGAVTTVDILATQTSGVKLLAFAQANLTQSTILAPGITGCAILADGVSFVANDAGTAITIGKTGSAVTTATHFDVNLFYVIEAA